MAWATCSWSSDGYWLILAAKVNLLEETVLLLPCSLAHPKIHKLWKANKLWDSWYESVRKVPSTSLCKPQVFLVVTMLPKFHSWHTETWVVKNPSPLLSSQTPPPWTRTSLPAVQLQPVPNKTKQDTKGRRPNLEIIWNHQTGPSPNFDIWDKGNIAVSPSFTYSIYFGYYIPHQKSSHRYWIMRCEGRESLQTFIYHWVILGGGRSKS